MVPSALWMTMATESARIMFRTRHIWHSITYGLHVSLSQYLLSLFLCLVLEILSLTLKNLMRWH